MSQTAEIKAELHARIDALIVSSAFDASDAEAMRSAIIAALDVYGTAQREAAGGVVAKTLAKAARDMAAILFALRGFTPTPSNDTGNQSFIDGFAAGRDAAEKIARDRWRTSRMSGDRIMAKVIANAIQELSAE